jgi:hypothetical protein
MPAARKSRVLLALAVCAAALALLLLLAALDGGSTRPAGRARGVSAARPHHSGGPSPAVARLSSAPPHLASAPPHLASTPRPNGSPASVTVATSPTGAAVPADFLGLSFEMRSLPTIASYATGGNLATLLRSLGRGVLRFGGASADEQVAWVAESTSGRAALPRWASTAIDAHDLAGIAMLARATGWRVLLTVNLGHYDPTAAAREAAAARAALGSYLAGIELGNEPDMYVQKRLRPLGWGPASAGTPARGAAVASYRVQAVAYRAAIEAAAPGVAIVGPDASTGMPGLAWVRFAARTLHPALLTDHYYPLSSCGYRPTVEELLSPTVRAHERAMLAAQAAIARAAATPLRVDEANSVSCEGFPGVSDSFASALWALEYTARALSAGVAGVNFHDLLAKPGAYSPLLAPTPAALTGGALRAQPEWYALLAARGLPGSRPLPTSVAASAPDTLSASAFRAPDGRLRLVLVDYDPPGSRALAVRLRVPRASTGGSSGGSARAETYTSGSVLRLTGPSPAATTGVRLGGRAVSPAGVWSPPVALPAVYDRGGALSVQLAPSSAAVVTLYPGRPRYP